MALEFFLLRPVACVRATFLPHVIIRVAVVAVKRNFEFRSAGRQLAPARRKGGGLEDECRPFFGNRDSGCVGGRGGCRTRRRPASKAGEVNEQRVAADDVTGNNWMLNGRLSISSTSARCARLTLKT